MQPLGMAVLFLVPDLQMVLIRAAVKLERNKLC